MGLLGQPKGVQTHAKCAGTKHTKYPVPLRSYGCTCLVPQASIRPNRATTSILKTCSPVRE